MKDYPEWDDFCRDAWKSFADKAYMEAAALKADRAAVVYLDVKRCIDALWEKWINNNEERRRLFQDARDDLIEESFFALQQDPTVSIPPEPQKNWVTETDRADRYYWPRARRMMADDMGEIIADRIDRDSETVLRHLHDPRDSGAWQVRGLVVGSIQAGKTANYSALIAKAADAGYRLIVVFAGVHNDLRKQTQERLDHEFTGKINSKQDGERNVGVGLLPGSDMNRQPQSATDLDRDFDGGHVMMEEKPWLIVMKKEKHRLEKLLKWLRNQRRDKPVLIIDDEADQASMNTLAKPGEDPEGAEDPENTPQEATRINALIREIIRTSPRCSYVGYTASPFANLFADASVDSKDLGMDLYPRDFIAQIATPPNYFGPREYFDPDSQEESSLFIPFSTAAAKSWIDRDGVGDFPEEARECLLQFLVSAALRLWRANRAGNLAAANPTEVSMLVHVSHLINVQKKLALQISDEMRDLRREIALGEPGGAVDLRLKAIFEAQHEVTRIIRLARDKVDRKKDWSLPSSYDELLPWIRKTAEAAAVQVVNGEARPDTAGLLQAEAGSDARLKPRIWVGGNKLSRGLTIPAPCMCIFLRATGAADTLLQMGRWFGYRDGYADLCRISTTAELADRFMRISSTLDDLNEQVAAMSNQLRSPAEYRLVVQQHPGFQLTSASKMRTAVDVACCYAGFHAEMRYFLLSGHVPEKNFRTAQAFLADIERSGTAAYDSKKPEASPEPRPIWAEGREQPSGCLWRGVSASVVVNFFSAYSTVAGQGEEDPELKRLVRWIERENAEGRLLRWNIWIPRGSDADGFRTLAADDFAPVERSGLRDMIDGDRFRLSILQSEGDQFIGVRRELMDAARAKLAEEGSGEKRGELFRLVRELAARTDVAGEHVCEGYMRLYAVRSEALKKSEWIRTPDGGRLPLIGYALWMPGSLSVRGRANSTAGTAEIEP